MILSKTYDSDSLIQFIHMQDHVVPLVSISQKYYLYIQLHVLIKNSKINIIPSKELGMENCEEMADSICPESGANQRKINKCYPKYV